MENLTEQQQAAHQAIAETTADLGPSFVLEAVADAFYHQARTESDERADNLTQAIGILRQLAGVLDDEREGKDAVS